jgi:hypothetical protein
MVEKGCKTTNVGGLCDFTPSVGQLLPSETPESSHAANRNTSHIVTPSLARRTWAHTHCLLACNRPRAEVIDHTAMKNCLHVRPGPSDVGDNATY